MGTYYTVIQLLGNEDSFEVVSSVQNSLNDAIGEFYQTMVEASHSEYLSHTVILMNDTGKIMKMDFVAHEPEPKEEDSEGEDPEIIK